jgi:hypothetical protein
MLRLWVLLEIGQTESSDYHRFASLFEDKILQYWRKQQWISSTFPVPHERIERLRLREQISICTEDYWYGLEKVGTDIF